MNRRTLFRTSALAAATLPLRSLAFAAPEPAKIRLGLASYTFRNFTRAQLIGFMQQLNLQALNAKDVKDHLPMDPTGEAAALADYAAANITLHAAGTVSFAKPDESDIRAKFEYAKRAKIPVIVAGDPTDQTLPILDRMVKEYDIRIAIHNHGPEDHRWHSPLDVLAAVNGLDPRIGCCIDVGHAARAGTDVPTAIRKVGPRLYNMHIKDLTSFSSKESQVAVGEGNITIPAIFEALLAIGYPGFVDLEYEIKPDDPLPGVIASFAYMRGVLVGMNAARA